MFLIGGLLFARWGTAAAMLAMAVIGLAWLARLRRRVAAETGAYAGLS
jgi:hypothetical protein